MKLYPWFQSNFQYLQQLWKSGRWPHALLLTAKAGTGLESLANYVAASMLCNKAPLTMCHECQHCHMIQKEKTHPEWLLIAPETGASPAIKVHQIRHLHQQLTHKSAYGHTKVVLIQQAHLMNESASNALLKMLEEPNQGVYFLLSSTDPVIMSATVRSRVQTLYVSVDKELTRQWFDRLMQKKVISTRESQSFELLWSLSNGTPINMLALHKQTDLFAIRDNILSVFLSPETFISVCDKLSESNVDWVIYWWFLILSDVIKLNLTDTDGCQVANLDQIASLRTISIELKQLFACYRQLLALKNAHLRHINLNKTLMYEKLCLILLGEDDGFSG